LERGRWRGEGEGEAMKEASPKKLKGQEQFLMKSGGSSLQSQSERVEIDHTICYCQEPGSHCGGKIIIYFFAC